MKKILILNGQYLPGYKGGGPIRSIQNLVENLQNEFEFYILTADRDFKMNKPYKNIEFNKWVKIQNYNVFYMTPDMQSLRGFKDIINNIDCDLIYLNGYFSPIYTIKPLLLRKMGLLKNVPIILSSRGDFSKGHLNLKKLKKSTYINISKIIGLYKGLYWHATSKGEIKDIQDIFSNANIFEIANLSRKNDDNIELINKSMNKTKLVFLSRICEKKNLLFALEILKDLEVEGELEFDIYGPKEDTLYWDKCNKLIELMPLNIKVKYKGEVLPIDIKSVLSKYHAFLFPTLGENYGHAIVEAFSAGCIPIISDQTPWRELEELGVGYDISLDDVEKFLEVIKQIHKYDDSYFIEKRNNVINYYNEEIFSYDDVNKYREMFKKI